MTATGRRLAPLAEVAGQITADGGSALAVPADVTDSQAMEAAVTAHEERFGRLDIVVANAGIVPVPGPVLDCPSAVWAEVLQTNLTGVWNTARAAGCAAPNITPHPSYGVQLATPYRYHFRADRCGSPAADRLPRYA